MIFRGWKMSKKEHRTAKENQKNFARLAFLAVRFMMGANYG